MMQVDPDKEMKLNYRIKFRFFSVVFMVSVPTQFF